jgi:plastocyanin
MKARLAILLVTMAMLANVAQAGEISGRVPAGAGASVVYVEKIAGKTFPAPSQHFSLDQRSLVFQPHVLVVPVGATVDFVNNDAVAHNVFWPAISGNRKLAHNLGTWPQGAKRSFTFDAAGVVTLLCNVHPEMSAYIVVSPTPYYAVADATGNYQIQGVPDGHYTLTVWHEGAKPQSKPVAVSGSTKLDLGL